MNKQELIDAVASDVGISKSAAADTVDAVLDTVSKAVAGGDSVQLIGLARSPRAGGLRARAAIRRRARQSRSPPPKR